MRARITAANDHHEREANRLASRVVRTPGAKPTLRADHASTSRPLDPATRAYFEPRFGHDFSAVRVHSDARAGESARALNALAYTVGTDVVFAPGRFAPHTEQGRTLLAHELAHVVQQRRTGPMVMRQQASAAPNATCSEAQQRKIDPAVYKADAWLSASIPALNAFLGGATTPRAQAAGAALEQHFHSTDPAVGSYVRDRLATIRGDLFNRPALRLVCPPTSDRECDRVSSGQALVAIVPHPNEIDLCGRSSNAARTIARAR